MRSKYGNVKTEIEGEVFDSRLEAETFQRISSVNIPGDLRLKRQVPIVLVPKSEFFGAIKYICDFALVRADEPVLLIESKGVLTDVASLKFKLLAASYPGLYRGLILVVRPRTRLPRKLKEKACEVSRLTRCLERRLVPIRRMNGLPK